METHLVVEGFANGIERIQGIDGIHQVAEWILDGRSDSAHCVPVVTASAAHNVIERRSHRIGHSLRAATRTASAGTAAARTTRTAATAVGGATT